MMHVLFRDGLVDRDYLADHTTAPTSCVRERGVDAAEGGETSGLAPARWNGWPRVRDHATAAIRVNYGLNRHAGGGMAVRTIACLPRWSATAARRRRHPALDLRGLPVDEAALQRPDLIPPGTAR